MGRLVNLMVRCGADFSALTRATKKAQAGMSAMQRASGALKGALGTLGVALSATAILGFGKACVDAASDLQEVQNVVDTTFGSMSGQIDKFAKNAITKVGLSELAAKQYSGTMGAMLKSMGLTTEKTVEMSMALTELAGDLASFYNLSADDAFAKIRAGISGETEPLKQLGINMSIANLEAYALSQGVKKAYRSMSQSEQALLRYNYLMSVTGDAQGDFSRTSGSWANQTRILAERFNQLKAALGQGLIQALTPVLVVINQLMEKLVKMAQVFSAVTSKLFGNQTKAATSNAKAVNSAATAQVSLAKGISAASKEAKKSLAPFDELNILQGNDAASGGGGSGGGINDPGVDIADIPSIDYTLPEVDVSKFTGSFAPLENVKKVLQDVVGLFGKIKDLITGEIDFEEFVSGLSPLETVLLGIAAALGAIAIASAGITIFTAITTFIQSVKGLNAVGLFGKLAEVLMIVASGAGTLHKAMTMVFGPGSIIAGIAAVIGGAVVAVLNFISMLQNGFSWTNEALMLVGIAIAAVGAVILGAPAAVAAVVAGIVAAVATLVVLIVQYGDKIKEKLQSVDDFLQGVFLKDWKQVFGTALGECMNMFFADVKNLWDSIKKILDGIIDFIGGLFTGDWERVWSGVVQIFSGIFGGLCAIVAVPLNGIIALMNSVIDGINFLISGLNGLSFKLPDWLGGASFQISIQPIPNIPYLANGAVIPPGQFLAVLGDQKHGNNLEAPESLIRQIVREEAGYGANDQLVVIAGLVRQILGAMGSDNIDMRKLAAMITTEQNSMGRAWGW